MIYPRRVGSTHHFAGLLVACFLSIGLVSSAHANVRHRPAARADAKARFLYVLGGGEDVLYAYRIKEDGSLKEINLGDVSQLEYNRWMTVTPNGRFLFVCGNWSFDFSYPAGNPEKIVSYRIERDGRITKISEADIADDIDKMAVDPAGRFLYGVSLTDSSTIATIAQYRITAKGSLIPLPRRVTVRTRTDPTETICDPAGRFLYLFAQYERTYRIGQKGIIGAAPTSVFRLAGDSYYAVSPSGTFAYAADFQNSRLLMCRIRPDGMFVPLRPATAPCGRKPDWISVDPQGRFLYVVCEDNSVYQYRIAADGVLYPLSPPVVRPYRAGGKLITAPNGRDAYMLTPGQSSLAQGQTVLGSIDRFRIGRDGTLTQIRSHSVPTAVGPVAAEIVQR